MAWTDPATGPAVTGEVAPASLWNTYVVDNLLSLGRSAEFAKNIGTGGGLGERWYYLAQAVGEGTISTATGTVNTFFAMPFVVPRLHTIDRLMFNVGTGAGAGGKGRAGIYQAVSYTNLYPGPLVVDGGEFDVTTTGVKSATVSTLLSPDQVYWAVTLFGTNAPVCTSMTNFTWGPQLLGVTSFGGVQPNRLTVAQTYGALPSTFPASGALAGGGTIVVAARFSA